MSAQPLPSAPPAGLEALITAQTVWHAGRAAATPLEGEPFGHAALDALLPSGWPRAALSEVLIPRDGVGELQLLRPLLARLTTAGRRVLLVAPPYIPCLPAWSAMGVDLHWLCVVEAPPREAPWAMEQALRSGSCALVLAWPQTGDANVLRRLQVAAQGGGGLGVVVRDACHAANPSAAALRLQHQAGQWQVLKRRGGPAPDLRVAIGH